MNPGFSTVDFETISSVDYSITLLIKPVRYGARDGRVFEIPRWQKTDFASTPRTVWGFPLFLIPTGWWSLPAMFHDAAYRNTLLLVTIAGAAEIKTPADLLKHECDDLLLEMMQAIKPNANLFEQSQMRAIYDGVTLGGWHAFREDRA